jgi:predicted naringenin-chalcone synthase
MGNAYLQRIGTATPRHDVHAAFVDYARQLIADDRERALFDRMVERSGIEHRYAVLRPGRLAAGEVDADRFYRRGGFPGTAERMALYGPQALQLALRAVHALAQPDALAAQLARVTHVVVASCTGFSAPGLDVQLVDALGLNEDVQRTVVGFMGCSAALPALRVADLAVRNDSEALVLVVNVELCSLHLHESHSVEELLSFLLFGDAASAALVGSQARGAELLDFQSRLLPASRELITWDIGSQGFLMQLSGQVPGRIAEALGNELARGDATGLLRGRSAGDYALWPVHAGGRTVLDAVQRGLQLPSAALADSREVLRCVGNVSSATVMFVLKRLLERARAGAAGLALAFGPGLSAESMRFRMAGLS